MVVALAPFLPIVGDLQPDAIRITEKCRPVVRRIFRIGRGFTGIDSRGTQFPRGRPDILRRLDAQAEMMQPRRIRIVWVPRPRRAYHKTELPVEVLGMRIAADGEGVLAETKHLHRTIVKFLRALHVRHSDVDVVNSDDVWHRLDEACKRGSDGVFHLF